MEPSFFPFSEEYPTSNMISFSRKRPKRDELNQNDSLVEEILDKFLALDNPVKKPQHSPILLNKPINTNNSQNKSYSSKYQTSSLVDLPRQNRARSELDNAVTTSDESTSGPGGARRRLWVKERSKAWWDCVNSPDFSEEEFKKAFRMSRQTFDMICEKLESVLTKKDTILRLAIPVQKRVAVCIWRLATGAPLRDVSKHFGLGTSTCHKIVLEVCNGINTVLKPEFLQWPDNNKMKDAKREFEHFSWIPNVGGCIYTTHVQIAAPNVNVASYFNKRHTERNQKTCYSVTVQGVVDHNGTFTDISVGCPGSKTDVQVLEKSMLFERANNGDLKDVLVVGNSGYPLMDWILVPYSSPNLTWAQYTYNEKIHTLQKVSKESFMRYKGRWKCLQKRTDMKIEDLTVVLEACCVLHNVCEMLNEEFSEELRFELFDDEVIPVNSVRSFDAISVRNQIAQKIVYQHL